VAARVLRSLTLNPRGYGHSLRQKGEVVMVEYISPNTNKPLHLGHIRNGVLGRSVANLACSQGAEVYKTDIVNDRGIHIAKSVIGYQHSGKGQTPKAAGIKGDTFVGKFYVTFDQMLQQEWKQWLDQQGIVTTDLDEQSKKTLEERFQVESSLMREAREWLRRWEANDPDVRDLWRTMNSWVYAGFDQTYALLGFDFDKHYYESEIFENGREVILDALEQGKFERATNGAIIAPLSKHFNLPDKVLLRADGTGLYITQDIYLAMLKFREFGLTRSLYCIGSEQDFYMRQLFATLRLLGLPWADRLHHLSYGMVYLPEGKMKSREGRVVDADDLIQRMKEMASEALLARWPALDLAELDKRSLAIGLAAVIFHFLEVGRDTEIHFDPKSSLSFEGKTGPYLQYTHARLCSILRKGAWNGDIPVDPTLEEDLEWQIVLGLLLFPVVVADAAEDYNPSRLCTYLIDLAQGVNAFYHDLPVLAAEGSLRSSRLAMVGAARAVIGEGLRLLGIEPIEDM
jgi:arginyl-tRNA synthetase